MFLNNQFGQYLSDHTSKPNRACLPLRCFRSSIPRSFGPHRIARGIAYSSLRTRQAGPPGARAMAEDLPSSAPTRSTCKPGTPFLLMTKAWSAESPLEEACRAANSECQRNTSHKSVVHSGSAKPSTHQKSIARSKDRDLFFRCSTPGSTALGVDLHYRTVAFKPQRLWSAAPRIAK